MISYKYTPVTVYPEILRTCHNLVYHYNNVQNCVLTLETMSLYINCYGHKQYSLNKFFTILSLNTQDIIKLLTSLL